MFFLMPYQCSGEKKTVHTIGSFWKCHAGSVFSLIFKTKLNIVWVLGNPARIFSRVGCNEKSAKAIKGFYGIDDRDL